MAILFEISHIGCHNEISQKAPKKVEKLLGENNRHTGKETSLDASEKQHELIVNSDHLPKISVEKAHSNRETYKSSEDGRKVQPRAPTRSSRKELQ